MRDQLIQAAIEKFGSRGFDAVGTREIAAAVDTPMSSITYHFGGKEGLYLAAAEFIFDYLRDSIDPPVQYFAEDAPRAARLDAFVAVLRKMAEFMLDERSAKFALFISREQQAPTPAVLQMMDDKVMPMMRALVEQVKALRPELAADEAKALTIYLFGMAIALRHTRASMSLLFEREDFGSEMQKMLIDQLEASVRAILGAGPR